MDSLEHDFLLDRQEDARTVEFIKNFMPGDVSSKFSESALSYLLDVLVEFYATSDILDAETDQDGFIEIDQLKVANHLAAKAEKDGIGSFSSEDLLWFVRSEMEFTKDIEE